MKPREIIRQFTPNWFTATMGTGILALALNQVGQSNASVVMIAKALWLFNSILFALFSVLYMTRWILFFQQARRIFRHSVMSMFFGAIPMGLATIINGLLAFGVPRWRQPAVAVAEMLWWLDAALALLCGIVIPFLMFTRQDHSIEKMTAVWLLPIVASEVASVSAALLVAHVTEPHAAMLILVVGYILWAFSVPLALSLLVVLVLRLILHKLPPKDMAASGWLSLGPIGTGALGLLLLGQESPRIFSLAGLADVGETALGLGVVGGVILWGYGVWWLIIAVVTTARYVREGMPFNLGWWGFVFPLGVYSLSTLALGRAIHLAVLIVIGHGLVACLALFWLIVAVQTARGAWNGSLFVSPCLLSGAIPNDFEADTV